MKPFDTIDFRNNKKQLMLSYLYRAIGIFLFGGIFVLIAKGVHPELPMRAYTFIGIALPDRSALLSWVLILIDVVFVLYLHEMIHATVFYLSQGQTPKIGIRGLVIFAAAPGKVMKKNEMIINGLAPFILISILGVILFILVPPAYVSWVFIPVVINSAASGGDFMLVAWMLRHPATTRYTDDGDIIAAYRESPI